MWEQELRAYVAAHPRVVVVDRLDKIRQLHNRATMLRPLQGEGIVLTQVGPLAPHHALIIYAERGFCMRVCHGRATCSGQVVQHGPMIHSEQT